MEHIIAPLTLYFPADIDILAILQFIGIFAAGALFLGLLGRVALGKRSDLNHAVSSAIGILFIYAVTIVIYTFNPQNLAQYLAPLPFADFSGDVLSLFSFRSNSFPAICSQVLSMIVLSFLVNLLDTLIPKGKKIVTWYLLRFLTVLLSIVLHCIVSWAFSTYLPGVLVIYAPMILLIILLGMMLLGVLKVILGLVLVTINPLIAALYTFFFASRLGKQLSKAVLTTAALCAVVYLLEYFGYAAISIAAGTLGNYIPLIACLLLLWYLVGHVL